jgi:hypothetical protein
MEQDMLFKSRDLISEIRWFDEKCFLILGAEGDSRAVGRAAGWSAAATPATSRTRGGGGGSATAPATPPTPRPRPPHCG